MSAILLAAGLSRRMGQANKLLLPVNGVAMIRHVAMQYRAAIDGQITVVTGYDADKVQAALTGLELRCIRNRDHEAGQQTSVACGLEHAPLSDLLLIGLGDQPLLTAADIREFVQAHRDDTKISIPAWGAVRGNPIGVPRALRARLRENPERPGCMRFTRDHPDCVQRHPLPSNGFYTDIDTPDQYAALLYGKAPSHEETRQNIQTALQEDGAHS